MFKSLRHLTNANPETDEKPTADTSSLRACLESGRSPETGVYGTGDPWHPAFLKPGKNVTSMVGGSAIRSRASKRVTFEKHLGVVVGILLCDHAGDVGTDNDREYRINASARGDGVGGAARLPPTHDGRARLGSRGRARSSRMSNFQSAVKSYS
jgi:hypothetical protein